MAARGLIEVTAEYPFGEIDMVLLQVLLSLLFRSAGRIVNSAFGWATIMLFGKVPAQRQLLLSIMAFASLFWLIVALGIAFPSVGTFLLTFYPLGRWVDEFWLRLIMLALSFLTPVAVGVLGIYAAEREKQLKDARAVAIAVLKGFPYTVGLGLALVMMIVIAPIMKVHDLTRRWSNAHVPMIVESKDYLDVVSQIQLVLRRGGYETGRELASIGLRWPTKVFAFFARAGAARLVSEQLTILKSPRIEVLLHPSDLVIRGRDADVNRVRALLVEQLTFTKAYQTWSAEANRIEDRLTAIWNAITADGPITAAEWLRQLRLIEHDLKTATLSFEEWDVIFREEMVIERRLLRVMAGLMDRPDDLAAVADDQRNPSEIAPSQ